MPPRCEIEGPAPGQDTVLVRLSGAWRISNGVPSAEEVLEQLGADSGVTSITFAAAEVTEWDSGLLTFLGKILARCTDSGIAVQDTGLPEGVRRLLKLASAVPPKETSRGSGRELWVARVGGGAMERARASVGTIRFLGECVIAFGRMLIGRAQFRRSDLLEVIQDCGVKALAIVSLINFLIGLILAYIGAVQLRTFGATLYVADLVAIGMTREMGAIMTGIVIAGRTGAAFAAQLGTMQVNEEIDAFRTMGISPIEFLVLPRMLALILMMPLLVLYADLMGILGGAVIGVSVLEITPMEYYQETIAAVSLSAFGIGIFKGVVFGVLVAIAGCLRGMQCGRSAQAVGHAATSAVVTGIVFIITSDAIITVLCDVLGI
jgi:phospholipid/cholesterol/gamma-HCH transport system permease protein